MMRVFLISLVLFGSVVARAQQAPLSGKITYLVGDAVYTSVGRDAGARDSTLLYVTGRKDTLAILKVLAVSSKSSVCRIVMTTRPLAIGEELTGTGEPARIQTSQTNNGVSSDTAKAPEATAQTARGLRPPPELPGWLSVDGRVSLQYYSASQTAIGRTVYQPGVVVNLRGKFRESPVRFELYGNFRGSSTGSLFASNGTNRTRLYRMSIDYDDTLNQLSVGRVIPAFAPTVGYVDGLVAAHRIGGFSFGTAVGYQPGFNDRTISTDMKKLALFWNYTGEAPQRTTAGMAYSRTYFLSQLDREVISSTLSLSPVRDLFLFFQGDVDVRTKSGDQLVVQPKLTNIFSTVNYRATDFLSCSVGLNAWRPSYSFSTISALPDSLFDQEVRTTPTGSLTFYLPGGISLYDTYSPRTSSGGFGHEYLNYTTISVMNAFGQGIMMRGTMNINATTINTTRGYGGSLQRSFSNIADVTLRYQTYRYEMSSAVEIPSSQSLAVDLMVSPLRSVTFWASVERLTGASTDGYSILGELSWRF